MSQFTTTLNQAITTLFIFKSNSYESSFTDSNSILMKMIKQLDENMTHVTQDQHALKEQMLGIQKELKAIKKNINEKITSLAIKMKKSNNSSSDYSNRSRSSSRSQFERNRTERRRRRVQELDFTRTESEAEEANQFNFIHASNSSSLNPFLFFTGDSNLNSSFRNLASEEIAKVK